MAEFPVFDLGRAYAQAADVKSSQQAGQLRGLQIQAAQRELNAGPKPLSTEETIGHANILKGLAAQLVNDSSDANVDRVAALGMQSGTITPADVAEFKKIPLEQRAARAKQLYDQSDTFLKNADPQKAAKPETGIGNVDPAKFTAASLQEYGKTVNPATGIGDYSKLIPVPDTGGDQQRSPYSTPVYTADGVYAFNNRTGTMQLAPGGPGILKTADDPNIRGAVAGSEKAAQLQAERQATINKKLQDIGNGAPLLDNASLLLRTATGSGIGTVVDKLAGTFGISLDSAEAAEALRTVSANLRLNVPRMEGPQSDKDSVLYAEAAANIGDSTKPVGVRMAAIREIRSINAKYKALNTSTAPQAAAQSAAARTVVRTGKDASGKAVVQYSDGTIEHAP